MEHVVTIGSVPDVDGFEALCSCGWQGHAETPLLAEQIGHEHRVEMGVESPSDSPGRPA
jgi:hypothetical protein